MKVGNLQPETIEPPILTVIQFTQQETICYLEATAESEQN